MSAALEIGTQLVALCNAGQDDQVLEKFYDEKIVSIEGQGSDEMPARIEGLDAVRKKWDWWYAHNEVHGTRAEGPFCGHRDDQFVVRFEMETTPKGGERSSMTEVALYTVAGGKIVQEEFLYLMG